MKKIILITVIGKNNVFVPSTLPPEENHYIYDVYFRRLIGSGWIIIAEKMYHLLPDKSPPFPSRKVFVITEYGIFDPHASNTTVASSFEEAFAAIPEEVPTVAVIADKALYDKLFSDYQEQIETIQIVCLEAKFKSDETFVPLPPFDWQPIGRRSERPHKLPFFILSYRYEHNPL